MVQWVEYGKLVCFPSSGVTEEEVSHVFPQTSSMGGTATHTFAPPESACTHRSLHLGLGSEPGQSHTPNRSRSVPSHSVQMILLMAPAGGLWTSQLG